MGDKYSVSFINIVYISLCLFIILFNFPAKATDLVQVIVFVKDVNDNSPTFIFPEISGQLVEAYFGAISASADPFSHVLRVKVGTPYISNFVFITVFGRTGIESD